MDATRLRRSPTEHVPPRGQTGWTRSQGTRPADSRVRDEAVVTRPRVTRRQAEDLWDSHGRSAYALAFALLGSEEVAMRAVALAMTDLARSDVSTSANEARRSLARHVYRRSTELSDVAPAGLRLPPAMAWLAQLAHLQRACLALCVYGGHTYQEAADLLGAPSRTVAHMLTSGLQELGELMMSDPAVAISG